MKERARTGLGRPIASRLPQSAFPALRTAVRDLSVNRSILIEPASQASSFHDFTHVPAHAPREINGELMDSPDAGAPDAGAPTPAAPTFPDYATIIANATVSAKMDAAWTATKAAATATSRREQGFWIKYDTKDSSFDCSPTFEGDPVPNDKTGAADPGSKPGDSGTVYAVGLYHTHTPMTHRTGGTRGVGPSAADERFHTDNKVAGVVHDYVESPAGSGSIPSGHPKASPAKLYSSGPNKRT
ncbi:MAG TPA: hypothetical protein VEW71_09990 [Allosphingosinicella sp.]|nr:hypothetical protein [Allosphingosinicella sp.]